MVGGGRAPCCDKKNVKKGPWSPAEDVRLVSFIQRHGHPNWRSLPKQAGLLRCGKSCRLRWINYLRPDVKRGNFTPQEELSIIRLHATFGNKWSKISSQLPGRTDNEIKNVWNTHLKKRAMLMANNNVNNNNETLLATPSSSSATSNVSTGTVYQHQNTNNGFKNQQHSSSLPLLHNEKQQAEVQTPKVMDKEEAADTHVLLPSTPSSTMPWNSCQRHDEAIENILEIPLEPEVEFWNMLDDIQLQSQEEQPISFPNESWIGQEMEVERWMRLLEDELGLVGPLASDQTKTKDDGCNPEIWCQVSDQISPLWPQHIGL